MSRYDGLIIPRSYSEYINKTDAATLLQALQQSGVMDAAPTANSNHPVKSSGVYNTINTKIKGVELTTQDLDTITEFGEYYFHGATCANAPTSAYEDGQLNGTLEVNYYNNSYIQTIKTFAAGIPYIATRRKYNDGNWGSWYQIASIKTKAITATTDSNGYVNVDTINMEYEKKVIISAIATYQGYITTGRSYIPICDLYTHKYIIRVTNADGTTAPNVSVSFLIFYLDI